MAQWQLAVLPAHAHTAAAPLQPYLPSFLRNGANGAHLHAAAPLARAATKAIAPPSSIAALQLHAPISGSDQSLFALTSIGAAAASASAPRGAFLSGLQRGFMAAGATSINRFWSPHMQASGMHSFAPTHNAALQARPAATELKFGVTGGVGVGHGSDSVLLDDDVEQDSDAQRQEDVADLDRDVAAATGARAYAQSLGPGRLPPPRRYIPLSPADAIGMPPATAVHAFTSTDADNLQMDAALQAEHYERMMEEEGGMEGEFEAEAAVAEDEHSASSSAITSQEILRYLSVDSAPKEGDVAPGADKMKLQNTPHDPAVFFQDRPRTLPHYNFLLRVCGSKGLYDEGMAAFEAMRKAGMMADDHTYTALVSVCNAPTSDPAVNKARLDRAFALLQEYAASHSGRVSEAFFNSLANAAGRLDSLERALEVLPLMTKHGVSPTAVTYTELLHVCRRVNTRESVLRAEKLFDQMKRVGGMLEPDTRAYNAMLGIAAHAKPVQAERAVAFFEEMRDKHYQPDIYTYANLIYACSRSTYHYAQTFEYFAAALAQGFKADLHLYNILLNSCANGGKGDVANALHVFQLMEAQGVQRDKYSYNTMLNVLAESQSLGDRVAKVMAPKDGSPLVPEAYVSKNDRIDMAMALLNQMVQTHIPVDQLTINTVVKVSARALRLNKTLTLQEELLSEYKMQADFHSHKMLVDMFTAASRLPEALNRLSSMRAAGFKATRTMYRDLLKKVQKPKKAMTNQEMEEYGHKIMAWMREDGVPVRPEDERLFDPVQFGSHVRSMREAKERADTTKSGLVYSYTQRQDAMLRPASKRAGSGRTGTQADRHAADPKLAKYKAARSQRAADAKDKAQGIKPAHKKQKQIAAGHIFD